MTERIARTEAFLREKLKESPYFAEHPEAGAYRLEHSFRVARIGAAIARAEGMDEELMTIACLLHDVSYCRAMLDQDTWKDHGRSSAHIARPFLESLDLPEMVIGEMCYGIAIHVMMRRISPESGPLLPGPFRMRTISTASMCTDSTRPWKTCPLASSLWRRSGPMWSGRGSG